MNIQTHPNFKTAVEDVRDAKTIFEYVGYILQFQGKFEKILINDKFGNDKISEFKIDLEKIDRLYYLNVDTEDGDKYNLIIKYHLIARMQYNQKREKPVYFEMIVRYPANKIEGIIYVTRNVNVFVKRVINCNNNNIKNPIYEFLKKDGIYISRGRGEKDMIV